MVGTRPEKLRALIANEPRTYREALVDALRRLRPLMHFSDVEPDLLEAEVERLRPHFVVCSHARAASSNGAFAWVRLYPGGDNLAEVVTAGGRATIVGIGFADILSLVDGAEFSRRRSAAGEGAHV